MRVMMHIHYGVNQVLICQVRSRMENSIRCVAHILHMVIVYKQSPHLLEIFFWKYVQYRETIIRFS